MKYGIKYKEKKSYSWQKHRYISIIILLIIFFSLIILCTRLMKNKVEENINEKLYGITIDDSWYDKYSVDDIVSAITSMDVKPTVRIVMSGDKSADEYKSLFSKLSKVAYIMASPVDSYYMNKYKDSREYLKKFRYSYEKLGNYVNIWEIGNEINGVEWIKQDNSLIVDKVVAANRYIKSKGGKTALTLYLYNPEKDMFKWISDNIPKKLSQNVDYALISYYEDDNEGYKPKWKDVFDKFEKAFPDSKIGIGECGNTAENATEKSKIKMARAYYSMKIKSKKYIGGYFWWNFVNDCVPHKNNKILKAINDSMTDSLN